MEHYWLLLQCNIVGSGIYAWSTTQHQYTNNNPGYNAPHSSGYHCRYIDLIEHSTLSYCFLYHLCIFISIDSIQINPQILYDVWAPDWYSFVSGKFPAAVWCSSTPCAYCISTRVIVHLGSSPSRRWWHWPMVNGLPPTLRRFILAVWYGQSLSFVLCHLCTYQWFVIFTDIALAFVW